MNAVFSLHFFGCPAATRRPSAGEKPTPLPMPLTQTLRQLGRPRGCRGLRTSPPGTRRAPIAPRAACVLGCTDRRVFFALPPASSLSFAPPDRRLLAPPLLAAARHARYGAAAVLGRLSSGYGAASEQQDAGREPAGGGRASGLRSGCSPNDATTRSRCSPTNATRARSRRSSPTTP